MRLNILAFAIGGFIVGLKSAGRTILEPGISAAVVHWSRATTKRSK